MSKLVVDRILFAVLVIGGLMIAFSVVQGINTTVQLSNNEAQQVHDAGGVIDPQSTAEARGLVAADLARRRLIEDRWNAMVVGGGGLVLIAVAWLASDFRKSRRGEGTSAEGNTPSASEI